ncbi:MAG: PEP/pyruvate-binding domain-containing protein [bacterium]
MLTRLGFKKRSQEQAMHELRWRYYSFKELLNANNDALQIIADLENKLLNPEFLTLSTTRARCTQIAIEVFKIIRNLQVITGKEQPVLMAAFERICLEIENEIAQSPMTHVNRFVLPLDAVDPGMRDAVGAKSVHIAEMKNLLGLPVPEGFVITTLASQRFYEHNRLRKQINSLKTGLDIHSAESVKTVSRGIQELILTAGLPEDLEEDVREAYRALRQRRGSRLRLAVRSSAIGEDSVRSSFAGLYESYLNVDEQGLLEAYKKVLASKYGTRAIYYKASKGIRDEDIPMCVCCLEMVEARVSGVMYTRDPFQTDHIFVSAGWGLGPAIASGEVSPDSYVLDKESGRLLERRISGQQTMLVSASDAGTRELPVPEAQADRASMGEKDLADLVEVARRLEAHYGQPQDVEFSIDHDGRLVLLQTRPLALVRAPEAADVSRLEVPPEKVLLAGREAETACAGIGSGIAHKVRDARDLERFPPMGGVLVVRRLMPEWIGLMGRVKAIVAEVGSPTGHMASMAREFKVPMVVNMRGALERVPDDKWITLDATNRVAYLGRIEGLAEADPEPQTPSKGSPAYGTLEAVLSRVAPLHLTNPRDRSFRASSCRTLHDIMRFSHEEAINSMFAFNDQQSVRRGRVFQLKIEVPLRVFVVDLGGGLADVGEKQREVSRQNVASIPLKSLLEGMMTEGVQWAGHVPIGLRSFVSVFANTLYDPLKHERELGARSYAIVSRRYVNFSSRLGYHFSTLDAYCGEIPNSNYITFRFKGGAASQDRRERRAEFIARILAAHDFWVDQQGDLVNANYKKYPLEDTLAALVMLGRLMGCARQLDVVMENAQYVDHFVDLFLQGRYNFFGRT